MPESKVSIHRVALHAQVRGEPQRLEPLARRLREVVGARLRRALAQLPIAGTEGATLFIDTLTVDCSADSAWDDEALALQIARGLAQALNADGVRRGARRYIDRADFLADWIVAADDGTTSTRWWFDEFEGLRPLSPSTALRTLLINEGEAGLQALARLTEAGLAQVLGRLSEGDAARLLAWADARAGASAAPAAWLWRWSASLTDDPGSAWIAALVACERAAPGSGGARSLAGLRAGLRLRAAVRSGAWRPVAALDRLAAWRELVALCGDEVRVFEAGLPGGIEQLVDELAAMAVQQRAEDAPWWLATRYGGAFMLLARMVRLGWLQRWRELAQCARVDDPDAHARWLALQVVALALGGEDAAAVRDDPALRRACAVKAVRRVPHRVSAAALDVGGDGVDAAAVHALRREVLALRGVGRALQPGLASAAARLLADFAQLPPGLAGSSVAYLRSQALALPGVVECSPDGQLRVRLGRAPLDVLLVLCGAKRATVALPGAPVWRLVEDIGAAMG